MVEADAGVGKSALAARLALTRAYAYHSTSLPNGQSPEQARHNLTAQLIVAYQLRDFAPGTGPEGPKLLNVLRAAADRREATNQDQRVVLIVDGLNEAAAPGKDHDAGTGIPLGLPHPRDLPPNVFIVVTCRVGTPRGTLRDSRGERLKAKEQNNTADMRLFLTNAVSGASPQRKLKRRLKKYHVDPDQFVKLLLERCGDVWIYLRYVLDDIIAGRRRPDEVQKLPEKLINYYLGQIDVWRDDDPKCWQRLRLPVLATLVALRRPATYADIVCWAGVSDEEPLQRCFKQELRPFLDVTPNPDLNDTRRYEILQWRSSKLTSPRRQPHQPTAAARPVGSTTDRQKRRRRAGPGRVARNVYLRQANDEARWPDRGPRWHGSQIPWPPHLRGCLHQ